eukprot:361791-Chlamydomonas_euryale.AAC.8
MGMMNRARSKKSNFRLIVSYSKVVRHWVLVSTSPGQTLQLNITETVQKPHASKLPALAKLLVIETTAAPACGTADCSRLVASDKRHATARVHVPVWGNLVGAASVKGRRG